MKRTLFTVASALLAFGLILVGCETPTTAKKTETVVTTTPLPVVAGQIVVDEFEGVTTIGKGGWNADVVALDTMQYKYGKASLKSTGKAGDFGIILDMAGQTDVSAKTKLIFWVMPTGGATLDGNSNLGLASPGKWPGDSNAGSQVKFGPLVADTWNKVELKLSDFTFMDKTQIEDITIWFSGTGGGKAVFVDGVEFQ